MIICPSCGGKRFAVYDDCDQAMCLNCMTVLFNFSFIEEAHEIAQKRTASMEWISEINTVNRTINKVNRGVSE